jgi:metal-dependent amidase/aminoacylase/carboxypeptidase family protein
MRAVMTCTDLVLARTLAAGDGRAGSVRPLFEPAEESPAAAPSTSSCRREHRRVHWLYGLHCDPSSTLVGSASSRVRSRRRRIVAIRLHGPGGHGPAAATVDLVVAGRLADQLPACCTRSILR